MKTLAILALVMGVVLIAGFALATAVNTDAEDSSQVSSESSLAPSCSGGCSAQNSCGSSTCGVEKTGSCGCGR